MQFEEREFAVMITPRELLETSIAQLQMLAAFLSDQLSETADGSAGLETSACEEILRAVRMLIQTHHSPRVALRRPQHPGAQGPGQSDGVSPGVSAARAKPPASVTAASTPTPVRTRVSSPIAIPIP